MFDTTNWMMVFLRAGAMIAVIPVFSSRAIPIQVRVALAALVGFLIAPLLPEFVVPNHILGVVSVMSLEVMVGLLLGFVCRLLFFALEIAGGIISAEIGLMLPSAFNPLIDSQGSAPATILYFLAILIWLGFDLHHWTLVAFQETYQFVPIGGGRLSNVLLGDIISRTSYLFAFAVKIAAPIISISFLVTLVFAILGRTVPQMNVFFESFAFRIVAGLTVFGVTLHVMAQHIADYLKNLPTDVVNVAQMLGR